MSEINVDDMLAGYDDAPSDDFGFVNKPIPKGRYPFKYTREVSRKVTQNGVPSVTLRAEVTEGPLQGQGFLDTWYLGANRFKTENGADGKPKRDAGGQIIQVKKTEAEFEKARIGAQGRIKTFRTTVLGLPASITPKVDKRDPDYMYQFFGVDQLVGQSFMGEVTIDGQDRNNFMNRFPLGHKEMGVEKWRATELPKQVKAAAGKGGAKVGGAQEI